MRDVTPYVAVGKHVPNLAWYGLRASANNSANQAALDDAVNDLPATGGALEIPGDAEDFGATGPWIFNKPVRLFGQGAGYDTTRKPTLLTFDTEGIVLAGLARQCHLSNFNVKALGGVGLRIRGTRPYLENMVVTDCGSHGVFLDTAARTPSAATESGGIATLTFVNHGYVVGETFFAFGFTPAAYNGTKTITAVTANTIAFAIAGGTGNASVLGSFYAGNANVGQIVNLRSGSNGGDGLRIEGADSNVVSVFGADCSGNARGIALYSAKATIIGAHAAVNTATVTDGATTMTVDYYDKGSSNVWIDPYSEGSKAFFIDTDDANDGVLMSTAYGAPTVWSGLSAAPVANGVAAFNTAWEIKGPAGVINRGLKFKDPAGTVEWRIASGQTAVDQLQIRDQINNRALLTLLTGAAGTARLFLFDGMDVDPGTGTGTKFGINGTRKLSFWGKTRIIQPASANQAAVATTAATNATPYGYTQAQADGIITLLNEIRSALVNVGIIKGSA